MKLFKREYDKEPQLMIIPMIDIVFFLLVFFMISTLSMVQQNTFPINLPQAKTAQTNMNKTIPITVQANGKIRFDQEEINPNDLAKRTEIELKRSPHALFIVRGDGDVQYKHIISVFDGLKQAGVEKVSIAVQHMR